MRIAFLTPEFVTDYQDGGGLGNYLNRMSKLLVDEGHEVEVFVCSELTPRILGHGGVRVQRVPAVRSLPMRLAQKISRHVGVEGPIEFWVQARAMAAAFEARHEEAPFDLVQSADYQAVGLFVPRKAERVHLVRCSCPIDLYNAVDTGPTRASRWQERMERQAIRQGDVAYAPSHFVAEHFRKTHALDVRVVRPARKTEVEPAGEAPAGLPERFFFHFGQLIERKGTLWLAEALRYALKEEPGIQVVVAGGGNVGELGKAFGALGAARSNVQLLYPLPKPQLYAVLQRADAAVLPSLVDNLPNTVIESLMFGIPVIGTRGASIDELVEDGVTGALVELNNAEALAEAMVRFWRRETPVRKGFVWSGGLAEEMQPENAVKQLLSLVAQKRQEPGAS